ncbi:hypothetical protein PILCRDRAFT_8250 [Piloderma croceum F 1598]|uniref:Enoyl reductase (ER) domain-containing protein n=1 Tax=Piloderma croceum (strain F 1598) TaxID=765440 RepID=A0A0C3FBD7_PILCF|nr:hypothetical protein PILCRDRAFT_8250 [Piloderma croceum F 1598]
MPFHKTAHEYRLPKSGGGIHSLLLSEVAVDQPKPSEVLLKIHAVSLQYRDVAIATGTFPLPVKDNLVPGSDCAGEIVSVGEDVEDWKQGDKVCVHVSPALIHGQPTPKAHDAFGGALDGVLVEYRTFPAQVLVRFPDHLSYEEASTLPCAALTAYNALMGPKPLKGGDTVLVLGTGGVSTFALQFAVASGATVILTSSSDDKLQIAKRLGAQHVINYQKNSDWHKEVLNVTKGLGADHIIEVGGPGTLPKSFQAVKYGGWIHSIGAVATSDERVHAGFAVIHRSSVLRGIIAGSMMQFNDMNRLLSAKKIHPQVDRVFSFHETKDAFEYFASQKHVGKVVIKVSID